MKKNFFIRKIMNSRGLLCTMVMIGIMILATATTAYGQQIVCQKNAAGNCVGTCPPLYNGDGTVAGNPVCEKVGNICKCTHLDIVTNNCTVVRGACKGKCDPLYRSIDDAKQGRNPVKGKCQSVAQGTARICVCRYTL